MCYDICPGLEPFSSLTVCRLLVGAPYEMNGPHQTGDVYKCSINRRNNGCSKLNLGRVSQHTARPTTHTTQSGNGNQDAHLTVNTHMWGTDLWVPYQSFHIFLLDGLCTFPRVCYTTHLTTGFFIGKNVLCRLDWHMKLCGVNIWNSGCSVVASATHTAITYRAPDDGTSVRVLENKFLCFCLLEPGRPVSSL